MSHEKIQAIIASGDLDSILVHLANANLSVRETEELLASGALEAAKRKRKQSEAVKASVSGVEDLVPNAGQVEERQAGVLEKFAKKLTANRSIN